MGKSKAFAFHGGAASYFGTGILAFLVTVLSLGIALPFAIVLRQTQMASEAHLHQRASPRVPRIRHKPVPQLAEVVDPHDHHYRHLLVLGGATTDEVDRGEHGLRSDVDARSRRRRDACCLR